MARYLFLFLMMVHSLSACALCGTSKISWVDTYLNVLAKDDGLQSIHVQWKFDSGTSKDLKSAYPKPLVGDEKEKMYKALETLQKPYFMTTVLINGKEHTFKAENFELRFENATAIISFDIPIQKPLDGINVIEILFLDSTRAMAFLGNPDHATLENTTSFTRQKSSGFKVIKEMMATINYVKISVTK